MKACLRLGSKSIVIALGYVKFAFALAENCAFAVASAVAVPLVGQRKLLCRRPEANHRFNWRGLVADCPCALDLRSGSPSVHSTSDPGLIFVWIKPLRSRNERCEYKLANDGHDTRAIQGYLGHRSIVSTQRYAALAPGQFKNFWKD
jgi:type 1 fimbriae regulatory protein FimB/type 1 fimbriae regulatory protein FimE